MNIDPKVIFYNMSGSKIGNYSGIGMYSYIGTESIGKDVMIGEELIAISKNHEFADTGKAMREQGFQEEKPVVIEDDIWIGGRVIILPGVRVGRGSIIGAGAVVTENVEPFTIVGGNPARVIGRRDEERHKKD